MFYRTSKDVVININNIANIEKYNEDGKFKIVFYSQNTVNIADEFTTESLRDNTYESLLTAIRSNEVLAGSDERPNNEKLTPIEQHDTQMQMDDILNKMHEDIIEFESRKGTRDGR